MHENVHIQDNNLNPNRAFFWGAIFSPFSTKKLGDFFFWSASSNHFAIFWVKILHKKKGKKNSESKSSLINCNVPYKI